MKKPLPMILIHRSNDAFERSIANHKRAIVRLGKKRTPETLKEERAALKQLMDHDIRGRAVAPAFSALNYIRYLRGVLLRRL